MIAGPIVALLASLWIPLAADDPARADRASHQGTWSVTSLVRDGASAPAEVCSEIRRAVKDDHVVWTRAGKNFAGTRFEIDGSKSPRTIDLIPDGGKDRDTRILGIYRIDGDLLTICVADSGQPRPTAFEAGPGSRQTLQTFRRVKP